MDLTDNESCNKIIVSNEKFSVNKLLETSSPVNQSVMTSHQQVMTTPINNTKKSVRFSIDSILEDNKCCKTQQTFHSNGNKTNLVESRSLIAHPNPISAKYMDPYYLSQCISINQSFMGPYNYVDWFSYRNCYPNDNAYTNHHNVTALYNQSNVPIGDQSMANQTVKRKNSGRAVFLVHQRRGLENRFKTQKYITKPERQRLAEKLSLSDSQVKVWFQNRRMKWRHSKEYKEEQLKLQTNRDQQIVNSFHLNHTNSQVDTQKTTNL